MTRYAASYGYKSASNTSTGTLRRPFILVCSDHFSPADLIRITRLTPTAGADQIPAGGSNGTALPLRADWAVMDQPSGQFRSIGFQVNLPEKCASTTEETTPQYIVDEEAILQLMRTCPVCNRKCRCNKHTRGPYLIVYQSCYFCDYQRKWASQPEARTLNIHKTQTLLKRKLPLKGEVNTKAQPSQPNRTGLSEPPASPDEQSQHT